MGYKMLSLFGLLLLNCDAIVRTEQCATTTDCINGNFTNSICTQDHFCMPLLSQDCTQLFDGAGKVLRDNSFVVGMLTPLSGDNASDGQARMQAAQLAMQELEGFASGLPPVSSVAGQGQRHLTLVACDQVADIHRAAKHLITDLRVPAIIGPGFSSATLDIAKNYTIPSRVLMINPSASSPELSHIGAGGLVWRTSMSYIAEPVGITQVITQLEPLIRNAQGLSSNDQIRVAVLAKGDTYGQGLADAIVPLLFINGKLLTDAQDSRAVFLRKDFPNPLPSSFDPIPIITDLVTFSPHIVLTFGTAELLTKGIDKLEGLWPTAKAYPYYVISEGMKLKELRTIVAANSHRLSQRIRVFAPTVNKSLYSAFATRWRATFNTDLPDVYGTAGTYDATNLLIYAIVAAREQSITGLNLAEALKKTTPLPLPAVTNITPAQPSSFTRAFTLLQQGINIDYDGVSGKLDFDVSTGTGEAPNNYDILCVPSSLSADYLSSGQSFDTIKKQLVGMDQGCP